MRDDFIAIKQEDIIGWTSCQTDRIKLPYRITDDLVHDAFMCIVEATPIDCDENDHKTLQAWNTDCLRTLDAATISATLRILPYRSRPLAGIELEVDTADGRHLQQFIVGNAEPEALKRITEEFFRRGAAGLSDRYRTHWSRTYTEYKRRKAG